MPEATRLKVAFICQSFSYTGGMADSLDKYLASPLSISYLNENDIAFQLTENKQADFRHNKDILESLYSEYDVITGLFDLAVIEAIVQYPPGSTKHRCRFILRHHPTRWIELY